MRKPIFDNRQVIGTASSVEGARRVILSMHSIQNNAFTLQVWERPKHIQDMLDLPAGYVYAWSYNGGKA